MYETNVDQVTLHYDRLGSGEPLVLIHGLGEIKEGWQEQHCLADQFDLIIPELRGHGRSTTLDGISIENFAADILALLDHLNIESATICGLSMGGVVAQELYRQAPHRCRALILVSTFHYAPTLFGRWFYAYKKQRAKHFSAQQQKEFAAKTCLYSWKKEVVDRFFTFYNPNPEGYLKSLKACLTVDNRSLLKEVDVPTLVIGCQYDTLVPAWVQIHMHKLIPKSELIIFKDAGHIAKLEKTKEFNEAVRRFITKQQLPISS
ncbi:alpha/beta fold hydrolase [Desertibacillus haloalkaliphilus]|uniref:alpha/beta fold hydrolase n=1 Tax=Desertibacillus haloalkaliphilus TaxID=1328930 RepID=UPI001C279F1D|nr:alpha/beta hydrolase [Desertibacillus haloalkaliphilus]MBU8907556.1 alpha/beta hydrolase [Desertibacillus haloalkaliphilus]